MRSIGILGCGLVGTEHAACLKQLGSSVTLCYDTDSGKANAFARKFVTRTTKTASDLLSSPDIDAVYICTYHDTHAPFAIEAAEHGKHIFIEKPMALTEADCISIVEAVERSGVISMTGFKLRHYPLVAKAKSFVEHPTLIVAHVLDKRWPDDSWANDSVKGGGNVLSQGCHAVDLACELARSKPVSVYAEGGNFHHPKLTITDTLALTLTFESGALASLLIADAGLSPVTSKFSFQMMDGTRSVHLYDRLRQLAYAGPDSESSFTDLEELGFLEENRAFLEALETGIRPSADHIAGLRAQLILLRAIESARTHQRIDLTNLR
jgi:myo-inositol 2-dehydrogenase / D-chiro-inositol 1-dehydrogenase